MLYLTRSKKGKLILNQKKPSHWSKRRRYFRRPNGTMDSERIHIPETLIGGQQFAINEFPGSENIFINDIVQCELYIPKESEPLNNELWVTREQGSFGMLMLHHKEKPTRMRDSDEWKRTYKNWKTGKPERSIKKSGTKWTAWKGHMRVSEFPKSNNILFEDSEPTRVEVRITDVSSLKKKKIGVMLGSFDPIHIGHINIIRTVLNKNLVDEVLVVPSMQNPWKPAPLFDFDTRCNIIRSDVRPINIIHQSHDVVKVCAVEHALKSPYYSANTLDVLYSKYCPENELYIICGADVINSISSWKDYDERIKNRYKYIVFKRAGMTIKKTIEEIIVVDNDIPDISSTQIKNDLMSGKSAYPLITESTQWLMLSVKELSGR